MSKERSQIQLSDTLLNTAGTLFYFGCQWLLTVFVVRLSGYHDAGILSMAISITNIFYCIALYGIRNFQVTDIQNIYSDYDYLIVRIVTVLTALAAFGLSLFVLHINQEAIICSMVYMLYKVGEAFSDLCFGYFQKYNSYRKIFISYSLKGVITLALFCLVLKLSGSLLLTLIIMTAGYFLILAGFDVLSLRKTFKFNTRKFTGMPIFKICLPLMLYGGLVPILNFLMRYKIELIYSVEELGYFSSITMVLSILSTLMNSVFVTIIPRIAFLYLNKDFGKVKKLVYLILGLIALLLAAGVLAGWLLGPLVFSLVFGKEILPYIYLLIPTIFASIALTAFSFLNSVMISIRKTAVVLIVNLMVILGAAVLMNSMVAAYGMSGSVYTLIVVLAAGAVLLFGILQYLLYQARRTAKTKA